MTSNGDPVLNASSTTATSHDDRPRSPPASKAASPSSKENRPLPHNGHHDPDDAQNESEAETVVLDRDSPKKKLIKTESHDDDDDSNVAHLRAIREETARAHSSERNGRRRSSVVSHVHTNGAKHGSDRDAKSPVPTSPSSRTTSRHTKDTSPTDSTKSPVQSAHSPTQTLTRGRSASTVENRKRKLRDESFPKSIEPPRQKAKTEGLKDARLPHSPGTPGTARPHKRSQSTQSALTGLPGRKRREITALAPLSTDRWSDDSSENSSSPRPAQTPSLLQHARVKRSSYRALTSPARTMPKSKTDRFGATRLARESEKGDLDAVKEAFEEAPEELNQVDYAGIAPLQKAALQGHADVVHYLISKGCNTKCESNDRDTPLIDAVENGHLEVVKLLLSEGRVNPHHANKKGQRAIDVLDVEDEDHDEIEKVLKDAMRRETNTSTNDKHDGSERKQAKSASRLLYNEFNVETLIEKAGDGDILAVGELINSNIKPNITCGVAAARGGHYDILSILLASGLKADPDPSKHPETPMTVAIERGHLKIIQLLLEQDNFDPTRRNKEGKTYYELAEEKAGPRWEQERDVLKQAYDEHKGMHRSPRRTKKEPPNLSTVRLKRKISPKRDRSSSPRLDTKRSSSSKSTPVSAAAPQKSRRLMSGKEKASREGQRHKRVVDDESSDDQSEDDVRPPRKVKPRSYSLGEEGKPVKKPLKARSDDNDTVPRKAHNRSDESESDHGSKPPPKIRKRIEKPSSAKPTPEVDSPDERKPIKSKIKYKTMDDKVRKRKHSDASADEVSVRKTPTISAKSTPAPPERTGTPEAVRERRQEEQRLEAEARRRAAEAAEAEAEAQRKEEEEAARKAAEEEAKRKADAEAEAQRQAAEAEAARRREAEEAQRRAEEEERCRREMLAARQERLSMLPKALRRACELGDDRPLHFQGEELGISTVFLPLYYAEAAEIDSPQALPDTSYVCSFQVVGILGLPELDLAQLDAPYSTWPRIPLTRKQREAIMQTYDTALLAQDYRFPMEGTSDFDFSKITASVKEAKSQFLAMDGLYWIEEKTLCEEMSKREKLQPLLATLGPRRCRIRFPTPSPQPGEVRKKKPRRSFVDLIKAQNAKKVNGVVEAGVNGAA